MAVTGRPNVGKSTLVNALAREKVAIVSDKPQTTRRRISAVLNGDDYQLVLADLPGFQRPRDPLTERMQRTVDSSLEDVDGFLLVLAADERIGAGDRFVAERVFAAGPPVVVALNRKRSWTPSLQASRIPSDAARGASASTWTSWQPPCAARASRRSSTTSRGCFRRAHATTRRASKPASRSRHGWRSLFASKLSR